MSIIIYYNAWCAGHARRDTAAGARLCRFCCILFNIIILYYIILYYIVWCAGHARRDTAAGARRDPGEEHPPRRGAPRILYIKLLLSYNNIIR